MLRFRYRMTKRNLPKAEGRLEDGHGSGPTGRINKMRKLVTALLRFERIEGKHPYMDEARGYAERVIQEAAKHGDGHKPTMEMLDYWIMEKDVIHKLFKVLVPRYNTFSTAVTSIHMLPTEYPGKGYKMAVLELKGNPFPPVNPHTKDHSNSLLNVLLDEARKDYRKQKYQEFVATIEGQEQNRTAEKQPDIS